MDSRQEQQLGQNIKKLRLKHGLSQDELARKAGIPYTTLTKVETSFIKKPSVFIVSKIAKTLGVTIESLLL